MDAESLKSLGWILLLGGAFFLMMRYGCGAHMMGRHRHHGGHGDAGGDAERQTKDPVCGMMIDPKKAAAAAVRGGGTYYFCSTSCRDKFELAPDQYPGAATQGEPQHGGHRHG